MQLVAWPQGGALRGGGLLGLLRGVTPGSSLPGGWARAVPESWEWGVGPGRGGCPTGGTSGTVILCVSVGFSWEGDRRGAGQSLTEVRRWLAWPPVGEQ